MRDPKDNTLIRTIEKVGGEIIATPFDYIYILVRKKGNYQAVINIITDFVSCYKNKAIGEFDDTLQEGYPEGYIACIYNKEWETRK